jgi:hypothetical protein
MPEYLQQLKATNKEGYCHHVRTTEEACYKKHGTISDVTDTIIVSKQN